MIVSYRISVNLYGFGEIFLKSKCYFQSMINLNQQKISAVITSTNFCIPVNVYLLEY
jgi:hypothetical protein